MSERGKSGVQTFKVLLWLIGLLMAAGPAWADPEKSLQGDLVLPLPGGGSMTLKPVFLSVGTEPFAQRQFKMGDPDGGYKEYPTSVSIGGGFLGEYKGKPDSLYYLGKCEVTRGQYRAVMGEMSPGGAGNDANLPMSDLSWFQVQVFLDRYNQWLFMNAADKLPKMAKPPAF